MIEKCREKVYNFITTNTANSVECELIKLILNNYQSDERIYSLSCSKIMTFLESVDINLNINGFNMVSLLVKQSPARLPDYYDILAIKAKVNNPTLAREIFSIYRDHVTAEEAPVLIKQLQELLEKDNEDNYNKILLDTVLEICIRDKCALITDKEWMLTELLPSVFKNLKEPEEIRKYMSLISILQNEDEFHSTFLESLLGILQSIFESFNVNSDKASSNIYSPLILHIFTALGDLPKKIFHEYFDDSETLESIAMFVGLFSRLKGKVSLGYDASIYITTIGIVSKFEDQQKEGTIGNLTNRTI